MTLGKTQHGAEVFDSHALVVALELVNVGRTAVMLPS